MRRHLEVRHHGLHSLLYVGDDIVHNVDFRFLENKCKTLIKSLKAFTAVSSGEDSQPNFKDVVFEELAQNYFQYLVLGSCSTDISKLQTAGYPT